MSDLGDAVAAFLTRYPPDVELVWRDDRRRKPTTQAGLAIERLATDVVDAAERYKRMHEPTSPPCDVES